MVELEIAGDANRTALVQEIQHSPVGGDILHVDFHAVSMDEKGAADYESDIRGNSVSRKASRQRLLKDFGDGTHCPCIYCGARLGDNTQSTVRFGRGMSRGVR